MQFWFLFVGSIFVVWFSRRSLRTPQSHGFYRFFAWEAILLLITLRLPLWFKHPFSWHQIISWALLSGSIVILFLGVFQLKNKGRPEETRKDETLIGLEKTTQLVTSGIYCYIRHPLYASLLLLAFGAFFKQPDGLGGVLAVTGGGFLTLTARTEERENIAYFGQAYEEYRSKTKMFIPFLF